MLAACATGDGRELRPPTEPAPTTTQPSPVDPPAEFPNDAVLGDTLPGEFGPDESPGPGPDDVPVDPPPPFALFASWQDGATVSDRHTCDDLDVSPALTWTGVPDGTIELAITAVSEPLDAADPDGPLVHWIVTGIDPSAISLIEGTVPPGANELVNDLGTAGWTGPCPPEGTTRVLRVTLHALGQQIEGLDADDPGLAVTLLDGVALANSIVRGTVSR